MFGKVLIQIEAPVTQSTETVNALLKFYNHGREIVELPPFYRLGSEMVVGV
jgi:hypothetical protein